LGSALAGSSLIELAVHRAAYAQAIASTTPMAKLFDITKIADGVYNARAHAQAVIISGSVIFVNSKDVLVVDSQTRPSASAALINQIKAEITNKPVRYVVTTHFHDDHSQGNSAFQAVNPKTDFIAHDATAELIRTEVPPRLKITLEKAIPAAVEKAHQYIETASSQAEKDYWKEQIRQYAAFQAEMKNFRLVLPTVTLSTEHVIKDKAHRPAHPVSRQGAHRRRRHRLLSAEEDHRGRRPHQRSDALPAGCVSESVGEGARLHR
jgi:hypothetical protein